MLTLIGLVLLVWQQWPEAKLKLIFCDVGQGDATLMIWKDRQILVDGGPNNGVLNCLGRHLPFYDRTLEVVIASHAEADHITGLIEVIGRYRVEQFLMGSAVNDTEEYRALRWKLADQKIVAKELLAGDVVNFGPIKLSWIYPEKPGSSQVLGASTGFNRFSQVIQAGFGEFDWLLTGDIDTKIERQLVTSGTLLEVEVLKVAHHGSKYSSSPSFLEAVNPELAVIEVGKNSFGHPTPETLGRLKTVKAQIKRTDQDGDVVIISDGRSWRLE